MISNFKNFTNEKFDYEKQKRDLKSLDIVERLELKLPELENEICSTLGEKIKFNFKVTKRTTYLGEEVVEIYSNENFVKYLGKGLWKTLFKDVSVTLTGRKSSKNDNEYWFQSYINYNHPDGGSNGRDFIWRIFRFYLDRDEFEFPDPIFK